MAKLPKRSHFKTDVDYHDALCRMWNEEYQLGSSSMLDSAQHNTHMLRADKIRRKMSRYIERKNALWNEGFKCTSDANRAAVRKALNESRGAKGVPNLISVTLYVDALTPLGGGKRAKLTKGNSSVKINATDIPAWPIDKCGYFTFNGTSIASELVRT